jgi:hypothetical protein
LPTDASSKPSLDEFSWYEDRERWYLVSGTKTNARTKDAPERQAPRPYHHAGVIASAMGLAKRTKMAVAIVWIDCWSMRNVLRSWRKKIS